MKATTLLEKIESVLQNGDTKLDIYEKVILKYPEFLKYKTDYYDSEKSAIQQIKAEVGSTLITNKEKIFNIDKSEKPYRYSFVNNGDDAVNIVDHPIKDTDDIGYIYIIGTNLYDRHGQSIYKIGTTKDVDKRLQQLNNEQGAFEKHVVKYVYKVKRPYKVEHGIHCILDQERVNPKKEGFHAHYVESNIDLIKAIIEMFAVE